MFTVTYLFNGPCSILKPAQLSVHGLWIGDLAIDILIKVELITYNHVNSFVKIAPIVLASRFVEMITNCQ